MRKRAGPPADQYPDHRPYQSPPAGRRSRAVPDRIARYYLPLAVLEATDRVMRRFGREGRECYVWWGGYFTADGDAQVLTAIYPEIATIFGRVHLGLDELTLLHGELRALDQVLLVELHTHPPDAGGQNEVDAAHPAATYAGFISIVVPDFAEPRFHDLRQAYVYEYVVGGRWRQLDAEEIQTRFIGPGSDAGRAAVALDPAVAGEPQAQLVFSFAVNLLARLYPIVQSLEVAAPPVAVGTRLPRWAGVTVDEHARQLLGAINPPVRWTVVGPPQGDADCALVVGSASTRATATVFIGSDGWLASVSPTGPVPVGPRLNPVGAYAAACLGVGEVCKRLLAAHRDLFPGTPIIPMERPLAFSTFTYQADVAGPNPDLPAAVDLQRLTLVGVGAGGGALAFTLASLPDLRGILRLIEPDEVIDPNLNRYVWAAAGDALAGREKAKIAAALFDGLPHVTTLADPRSYHEAAPSLVPADYRYVVAAVHSREARRELQLATPMVLWDAGATDHGECFVWRMTLGTTECMHCKHPAGQGDPERDKAIQLAHLLGLGIETWIGKVRDNDVFREEEVAAIADRAATSGISIDLPRPGQRYSDWDQAQCGRLRLPEVDDEIPFACAPVMAGVLLAGEVIKEHYFPEAVLDSYYWNTLLGRLMTRNQPRRRPPRNDCAFCRDEVYLAQYRRRWQRL